MTWSESVGDACFLIFQFQKAGLIYSNNY